MKTLDFYFDFGSPYSYLAYHRLQHVAKKNPIKIEYYPVILGGIFKATNNQSPAMIPAKAQYLFKDMQDWSKHWDIPFQFNPFFPVNTFMLMRAAIGYQQLAPTQFAHYVATCFSAMFEHPVNLNDEGVIEKTLLDAGLSYEEYQSMIQNEEVKNLAKQKTAEAVSRGLFGVPTFFIENEMFWGQDRLHFIERKILSD